MRVKKWHIVVLLVAILALILIWLLTSSNDSGPADSEGPKSALGVYKGAETSPYEGVSVDGLDHQEIGPGGRGKPRDAWWLGEVKGLTPFVLGAVPNPGGGSQEAQTRVMYVKPVNAREMKRGLFPSSYVVAVLTERPGSPGYQSVFQDGIPVGHTEKTRVGSLAFDPAGFTAFLAPKGEKEVVIVQTAQQGVDEFTDKLTK